MVKLGVVAVLLAPQLWAALRRFGPAAHLSLLLASLVCITAGFVFTPYTLTGPNSADLTYTGFAALGLAGLVPLFWALQQMFPHHDFTVATVLAQALGLTLAATFAMATGGSTGPSLLDWAALALVLALYGAGLHVVHYGKLK